MIQKGKFSIVILLVVLLLSPVCQVDGQTINASYPHEKLTDRISKIAKASHKDITFDAKLLQNVWVPALVVKNHKVEQVLSASLNTTAFIYKTMSDNSLVVVQRTKTKSASMSALKHGFVSGTVFDESGQRLPGANVIIKGTSKSVLTDKQGNFKIAVSQEFPVTVRTSFMGLNTDESEIQDDHAAQITLKESLNKLTELVVTASRKSEALSKVPVTVETLTSADLRRSPSASFYDAISTLKEINTLNSSIAFTVYNTRGFQHPTNLRLVQLVDGADNSSPELGIPVANTIGPGELDVQRVELIPGASSSLYGLNASNGLLNLITKDPFTYQGLSISLKTGANNINSPFKHVYNTKASLYNNISIRYAKALNYRLAFKINLGYLKGQDWASGDFNSYNDYNSMGVNKSNDPGFNGANLYGDEGGISNTIILGGKPMQVSRTGYREGDLTDYEAKLLHADAMVHYKMGKYSDVSYTYRIGETDNILTRGSKIKLKNFVVQQHVLQLKTPELSFRSYINTENSGKSYGIRYLAEALNTSVKSNTQWNTDFQTAYNSAISAGQTNDQALQTARTTADVGRLVPGTDAYNTKVAEIRNSKSDKFIASGYFWHNEVIYDLSKYTKNIADIQVGADSRYSQVHSEGTAYADTVGGSPVFSYKFGGFVQAARDLSDKFRVVGSVRIDKARDINKVFTERIGFVYAPNERNNFRMSYQNGYRLPTFVEAYMYIKTDNALGIGGLKQTLESVNIVHNSYSYESVLAFKAGYLHDVTSGSTSAQALANNASLLKVSTFDYLKPEQNQTLDFSYKGSFLHDRLYVDGNVYGTQYNNFIQTFTVIKPTGGIGALSTDAAKILSSKYSVYQTLSNVTSNVYVYGASLSVDYKFYKQNMISGNFNYIEMNWGNTSKEALSNGFNTPKYSMNLSVSNPNVYKNVGFKVTYKWTDKTDWKTDFSVGTVPSWQTVDAQCSYRIPNINATFSLGGTNILNKYYTQYIGGSSIGAFYYGCITFDGLFTK